jgi:hypothetical protein
MSGKYKFLFIRIIMIYLIILSYGSFYAQDPKGTIKGRVIGQNSKEALIGSTVLITNTKLGATTNVEGYFTISNIPVGNYNLEIRSIGYVSVIKTDIMVRPDRITQLDIELKESVIQIEGVTVTSGYFQNINAENLGLVNFNSEEIKRSPGSMGDVSRIIMSLPSTSKVSDENNDLVVRGGSPSENGFFVDGIPVPNINHFPNIGSTGGPIGILNVDFIDNFNFLTSGFSASYGDKLSSIIDIQYREGNKEEINLQADLNWAGFGGGIEGPLPGKKGSWMFSFKRSYLDLFQKAAGLGMIIRYGDVQGKVTYEINKNHKISLLEIFGDDYEKFDKDDALDVGSNYFGTIKNYQNTSGVSWRAFWSKNVYSITNFSLSTQSFKNDFDKVSTDDKFYKSDNLEQVFTIKNTDFFLFNKWNKLELGIDFNYSIGKYDYIRFADTNRLGTIDPIYIINRKVYPQRLGLFLTYISNPLERFTSSIGIRADYYSMNESVKWSPRISIAYDLTNQIRLNANSGIFYQQLPMVLLSQKSEFQKLKNVTAYHYGVGLEFLVTQDTRLSLELYDKEYDNLPLTKHDPSLCVIDGSLSGNSFGNYDDLESIGKGFTRGVELMIQKKMSDNFYGILSASYFRSRYKDYNSIWRDRIYDNKFIFCFISGYKPTVDWEFSLRWNYAGGVPYTPFNFEKSTEARIGIIDDTKINSERYPDYHSLNVRIDKKFFFSSQSLDIYISVWNTYNRKNITEYAWNVDKNKQEIVYQWGLLPIFGIEWEL